MKLLLCLLAVALVAAATGCVSKPRFFQTQSERDEAKRQSPEYEAQEARWKVEREAAQQWERARIQKYLEENPTLPPDIARAISQGGFVRGMSEEQVTFVLGRPERINKSTGAYGRWDQWVYGGGIYNLYFKNGILDSWQSREDQPGR